MPNPYPEEFRHKVLDLVAAGRPPTNPARSTAAAIATKPPFVSTTGASPVSTPTCPNCDAWRGAVATT